ncbi:MAG: Gfo/Idh/MocA family oxidoreductase [Pirellulales bacterium]|nr:Gfo/Idh/MocA family oxidoreductase [Pirellulales bacterium]
MPRTSAMSRRRFLGDTLGAAGTAAIAHFAAAAEPAEKARESPRDPMLVGGKACNADPIRVGLIRCDTHGMYYGALMARHEALLLENPPSVDGEKHYSWQGGGIHLYFYTSYYDRTEMTVPRVDGFEIVKVWDEHPSAAKALSRVLCGKPKVCASFGEVSDDVDLVFIADCNGDGSDHLKLAGPGLVKGVPTFVDKPLAYDVLGALELIETANRHKTPLMSMSILRALPQAGLFRSRFAEVGEVQSGAIFIGDAGMAAQIHAICLAHHLFGSGVQSVESMGRELPDYVHLDYGGKPGRPPKGVLLNCASGESPHAAIYASAFGKIGAVHSPPLGDFEFPFGAAEILRRVKTMVRTGVPQVDCREMVESIAIATAARLACKTRRRVALNEVMP